MQMFASLETALARKIQADQGLPYEIAVDSISDVEAGEHRWSEITVERWPAQLRVTYHRRGNRSEGHGVWTYDMGEGSELLRLLYDLVTHGQEDD